MTPDRHPSEDELVRAHLHLANQAVNELARRLPSHVNRDDLCSAAMLGLAQAARSWEPERGASFERHAATRIRGALLDELRDSDWASRSVRSRARRLQQAGEELTGRLGRAPTQAELAAELGTDARAVHRLVDDVHRATVLNYESIVADGEADDLLPSGDRAPDHVLVDRERRAYLADAVLALPERLRTVVIGYFYQERPMLEIAAELGATESPSSGPRPRSCSATASTPTSTPTPCRPSPGPTAAWPAGGPPTTRPSPPAPTSGPGWTRPRGPCSSGPPRAAGRRPLPPESPFRQRIRLTRSLLDNISSFSPEPPHVAPFQTVCSVRTMAGTVVEGDAMTDPMLVRRLALDLRNLADKTLELRGVVEDYRHDLVRTLEDDWCDPDELQALHRQVQELWESMDRAEAKLRSGSRRMSPLLWLE
jgi:RNA polymerase sigma factor FliA